MSVTINGTSGLTFNNGSAQLVAGAGANAQTWQDVTASRVSGTTYTNSTGYPIQVQMNIQSTSSSTLVAVVGGVTIYTTGAVGNTQSVNFIVPNGATYSITWTNRSTGVWAELR